MHDPEFDPWKQTVIDACVINHLSWDETNPRRTLQNLIDWEVTVALDRKVSKEAQDIWDDGYAEGHYGKHK